MQRYCITVSEASANRDGISLCQSDCIVFGFERYCDDKKIDACKVDALDLKPTDTSYTVRFIEFKGGRTPEPWQPHILPIKAMDSLHCGFPSLYNDSSSEWCELFSSKVDLEYFIVCSDQNIIFTGDIPSLEQLKNRNEILAGQEEMGKISREVSRYGNRHPFNRVMVIPSSLFRTRHLSR